MSYQHLYDDGSSFTWGDGRQICEDTSGDIPDIPPSESECESGSARFAGYSNMSHQNPFLGDNSYYAGNADGVLRNNIYPSYPEADTTFISDFNTSNRAPQLEGNSPYAGNSYGDVFGDTYSGRPSCEPEADTDFNTSNQTPQLEGDSSFTGNTRWNSTYDFDVPAAPSFQEIDESGYSTDSSQSDQTPHFRDDSSFPEGAGDQFPQAAGTEILDHAAGDTMPPPNPEMIPGSTVGPHGGCHYQDSPQCSYDHIVERLDQRQSNEGPSQPQKTQKRKPWSKEENDKLLKWRAFEISYDEIAQRLGRTPGSCKTQHLRVIKLEKEAVPILRMKDPSHAEGETPGQDYTGSVDWTNPNLKSKRYIDWETPGLEEWLHPRLDTIRDRRNVGPWVVAWDVAAEELNEANNTDLNGKDLRTHLPYPGYLQSLRRRQAHGQYTRV